MVRKKERKKVPLKIDYQSIQTRRKVEKKKIKVKMKRDLKTNRNYKNSGGRRLSLKRDKERQIKRAIE